MSVLASPTPFAALLPDAWVLGGLALLLGVGAWCIARATRRGDASPFATLRHALSPGSAVIAALALAGSIGVALIQTPPAPGMPFWVYSEAHFKVYQPIVATWSATHPAQAVALSQIHIRALERRVTSGFLAETPVADLLAVERPLAAKAFIGPLASVGFLDLTDRLRASGILPQLAPASLTPWTSRGRIFGVPLDIHPVLLAYRSDLVEAAGIDVTQIETWDDYFRLLRPLQQDFDGDGRPDRWLLNDWDTTMDINTMILRQADGALFDDQGRPTLNLPRNAAILARLVTWFTGPDRVCTDVDLFSASGHQQRLNGVVIGSIVPDWMAGQWKLEMPGLAGKVKVMPLPAWEPGGRRTSVWRGGTMLGIGKRAARPDDAWAFISHLALSPELAAELYRKTSILPPNRALWSLPVFDEPDPYFSGQPLGRLYLDQAADVPTRSSSPYAASAQDYLNNALVVLRAYADREKIYAPARLQPAAQRLLDAAQDHLVREIGRNTFLDAAP